jgi:DNA polymerase-3 subunit delta'
LEEPQEKTLFLLVSEEPQQVLNTILSRVQLLKLDKLSRPDITTYLHTFKNVDEARASDLAYKHGNDMNRIVMELVSEYENTQIDFFVEWMRNCFKQKLVHILPMTAMFTEMGKEKQKQFLEFASYQIRNSYVIRYSNKLLQYQEPEKIDFYEKFGKYMNETNIQPIFEEINTTIFHLERNGNPKMLFTVLSLKIGQFLKLR